MKKLIMLFAVAFAAAAVNAATFIWSAANIYDHTGTAKYTGDVTLYGYINTGTVADAIAFSTVTTSATGAIPATTFTSDILVTGNNYNFFFIAEQNGYTFTSAEKVNVAALNTQTQSISFGNMTTQTKAAGAWVSSAVPEPTSGLLLLLGMAGLALKRKVA